MHDDADHASSRAARRRGALPRFERDHTNPPRRQRRSRRRISNFDFASASATASASVDLLCTRYPDRIPLHCGVARQSRPRRHAPLYRTRPPVLADDLESLQLASNREAHRGGNEEPTQLASPALSEAAPESAGEACCRVWQHTRRASKVTTARRAVVRARSVRGCTAYSRCRSPGARARAARGRALRAERPCGRVEQQGRLAVPCPTFRRRQW